MTVHGGDGTDESAVIRASRPDPWTALPTVMAVSDLYPDHRRRTPLPVLGGGITTTLARWVRRRADPAGQATQSGTAPDRTARPRRDCADRSVHVSRVLPPIGVTKPVPVGTLRCGPTGKKKRRHLLGGTGAAWTPG
jgi:hypothetical protein